MSSFGKILIFSAPSGSGKTTIVKHLVEKFPCMAFAISATTRPIRKGEEHGKDYYFFSPDEFQKKISDNHFVEYQEVYRGRFYGTLATEVDRLRKNGSHIVFDVDVQGGINLKKHYGAEALAVFVKPPSINALKDRLYSRNTDSAKDLEIRLDKAESELTFEPHFDYTLVNDDLNLAFQEIDDVVRQFLKLSSAVS